MRTLSLINPFGAPVYWVETTSSTMDESRRLAAEGAAHGTVVAANFQEAGRGRVHGRPWIGRPGENLYAAILFRYPGFAAVPPALTLKTGLAISLAIEDFAPSLAGRVELKWPNDIMMYPAGGRAAGKAAGILAEGDGQTMCTGFGVNLLQTEFPGDLRGKAASIALALPQAAGGPADAEAPAGSGPLSPDDRFTLLEKILTRLFQELEGPETGTEAAASWLPRLEERLYKRGEPVRFIAGAAGSGRVVEGVLAGIGKGGELLILPPGLREPLSFTAGELDVYGKG